MIQTHSTESVTTVPVAHFIVQYEKTDITAEISEHLINLEYSDYLSGQSNQLSIELEDMKGKWRDEWYPGHADTLSLSIGWKNQADSIREIGFFEIDEIEFNSPPHTVSINALATGINKSLRTKEMLAYESTTLHGVAQTIAERQGLKLVGEIEAIKLDRLTQQESDIEFLTKLADEYDYAFKISGDQLIFYAIADLTKMPAVMTLAFTELSSYSIRDQIKTVPKEATVKHHDASKGKTVSYDAKNDKLVAVESSVSKKTTSTDKTTINSRTVSAEDASAKGKADLAKRNRERTTGTIDVMGKPQLVSGNVITLTLGGKLSGDYLITASTHSFTRNGYTTSLEISRIRTEESQEGTTSKPSNRKNTGKGKDVYYNPETGQLETR